MHHLQSLQKRHCGKRVCLIPNYSNITTWNLLTRWKKPLICSQPDWVFLYCRCIDVACFVAMDAHGSWPYVADAADWIIVVSAAQLRRRRWQLCQQRVHSHKQAWGVQTHSHLECAAQLAATHTHSQINTEKYFCISVT